MGSYSNVARYTGLSGIDTESMVQQLMKAESAKLYKLQKSSTKLTWKQEAYWSVSDKLKTFTDKFISTTGSSSIMMPSGFNVHNASVKYNGTDSKAVSVSMGSKAVAGKYKLHVLELAAKDSYANKSGGLAGSINSKGEFDATNIKAGDKFSLTLDGVTKEIEFSSLDTLSIGLSSDPNGKYEDILNEKLDKAFGRTVDDNTIRKVNATVTGGKLDISTADVGHTLTINDVARDVAKGIGTSTNAWSSLAGKKFDLTVKEGDKTKTVTIDFSGYSETDLSDETAINLVNKTLSKNGVNASLTVDALGNISAGVTGVTRDDLSISGGLLSQIGVSGGSFTLEPSSVLLDMGNIANLDNNHFGDDDLLGDVLPDLFTGSTTFNMVINDVTITLDATDTMDQMVAKINASKANVTMKYNNLSGTYTLDANSSGSVNKIDMSGTGANNFLKAMKMADDSGVPTAYTAGKDSKFNLNGVTTTRESNTFTYEGITFTMNTVTATEADLLDSTTEAIEIDVSKDTAPTKQLLKDFVEGYNELIDNINSMVDEKRYKSSGTYYEPLTTEEKAAMSESEIALWEEKAKQGILSNDSILSGITSAMRSQLYQSVTLEDGTKLSLYQLGITTTSSYSKQGKLEIDDTKLEAALLKYGDKVGEFFTKSAATNAVTEADKTATSGIAVRIDKIIRGAIDSNGTLSNKAGIKGLYTEFDNDMLDQITATANKISDMITYLTNKENNYYTMFSKMEVAMTQADSQMSYLQQMLGM